MQEGEVWVHDINALIDPDEDLDLRLHPQLWRFLEPCTADARIYPAEEPRRSLEVGYVRGLSRAHFFAHCLRSAVELSGFDAVAAPLNLAAQDEGLNTLAWIAELRTHPSVLDRFGFILETSEPAPDEEVPLRCALPTIANLGAQAIIAWLDVDVTMFSANNVARGIRVDQVHSVSLEVRARIDKEGQYPELVVDGSWPTVALTGSGARQTRENAEYWNVEIRDIRGR